MPLFVAHSSRKPALTHKRRRPFSVGLLPVISALGYPFGNLRKLRHKAVEIYLSDFLRVPEKTMIQHRVVLLHRNMHGVAYLIRRKPYVAVPLKAEQYPHVDILLGQLDKLPVMIIKLISANFHDQSPYNKKFSHRIKRRCATFYADHTVNTTPRFVSLRIRSGLRKTHARAECCSFCRGKYHGNSRCCRALSRKIARAFHVLGSGALPQIGAVDYPGRLKPRSLLYIPQKLHSLFGSMGKKTIFIHRIKHIAAPCRKQGGILPESQSPRVVAAHIKNYFIIVQQCLHVDAQRRNIQICIGKPRCSKTNIAALEKFLKIRGAEIRIYYIQIDNADALALSRKIQRKINRNICLSRAVMTRYDYRPAKIKHFTSPKSIIVVIIHYLAHAQTQTAHTGQSDNHACREKNYHCQKHTPRIVLLGLRGIAERPYKQKNNAYQSKR